MRSVTVYLFILFLFSSCVYKPGRYQPTSVPPAPDYADPGNWAALPGVVDMADQTPRADLEDRQGTAQVDVFFMHPTTYTGRGDGWNASIDNAKLREKTDRTTILYQASIFNGAGRVFAPRYRQAHLQAFFTKDKPSADQALELAYADIKASFQYYLEHYNQNRPIIIAGHSQGALHGRRLLQEFFDGKPLQRRLVVAYLVGWPVYKKDLSHIPVCSSPNQTGCVCSWRTLKEGYIPKGMPVGDSIVITNPLTWSTGEEPAPKHLNQGAVIKDFHRIFPELADARIYQGVLWAHKPRFPGSFLFWRRNYHIADLNFYYLNIRSNAISRVDAFWK